VLPFLLVDEVKGPLKVRFRPIIEAEGEDIIFVCFFPFFFLFSFFFFFFFFFFLLFFLLNFCSVCSDPHFLLFFLPAESGKH